MPSDGQPISLWPNQNSALLNIIEGVKRTANEFQVEMLLKAGLAHYDAEYYNEALAVFDQALLLAQPQEEPIVPAPLLARLYQGKGDAYFIKKSLSDETWKNTIADALTNYERALHYDTSLLHSHEQRGRALFHLGRYDEAISSLEEALTRGSLDPDVLFCKYETLRQLYRTDEALTFYEQAYERWLTWGKPHLKAAQLFEDEGRFEQALPAWERAISLMPDQSEGYLKPIRITPKSDKIGGMSNQATRKRERQRTPNNPTTTGFRISDKLWVIMQPLLPMHVNTHRFGGGRPRVPDRDCADAIFFVLRTGCQ